MALTTAYPVEVGLDAPLEVARWRPIVQWLLAIPHFIVLYVLAIVAYVLWIVSFFAILFTGNMPESIFGFQAMYLRYQWRITTYAYFMREPYPPFQFDTTPADPGGDPATLQVERPASLSRWMIFLKWLFAIPHFIVLTVLGIGVGVVVLIAFFAVIITGGWPEGWRRFVVGYYRWANRVYAYVFFLRDEYPPFSLD